MRFKINFNSALVVSFLWHLLFFFMVTIVIVPVGLNQKRLSEVYFLGSLPNIKAVDYEFKSADGFLKQEKGFLGNMPQNKTIKSVYHTFSGENANAIAKKKQYNFKEKIVIQTEKIIPGMQDTPAYNNISIDITVYEDNGVPANLLSKPLIQEFLPTLEAAALKYGLSNSYSLTFLLSIKDDGSVENYSLVNKSGMSEIDNLASDYIKQCIFNSTEADTARVLKVSVNMSF
jgi:hypothetical protein